MLKINSKWLIGILIVVFFAVALIFRTVPSYDQVFVGDWIKFTSNDAYYHMRLVDNLVHNFPNLTKFDPYLIYPGGMAVTGLHFFDWLLSIIIWVIGLGSPTQHTIDVIGAYFPTILAALTVIPVYFIGKALFNRWTGVLAAGLMALLPGEFLGRSILGFTDHHVAETLFSTIAVLFLILAIKSAGQRQLSYSHLIRHDLAVIIRPLVYSLLAGIFLGIYLITWQGGLLFVFIISLYIVIQFIIDHLRHKSADYLGIIGAVLFLVTLISFLPFSLGADYTVTIFIALFIPLVLSGISVLMSARQLKPAYYPLTLVGIGIIFMAIFFIIAPDTLAAMLGKFSVFAPAGATATTTLEMQPFLSPEGSFTTAIAWGNFTTSFFLVPGWPIPGFALISFIILIWLSIKQRADDKNLTLFLIWTLVILVATLVQRRFAYYLVVNVALLSAYLSWQAIWLAGLRKLVTKPEEKLEKEPQYLEAPKRRSYYEILGIGRGASYKEIKAAFRKLASKYHSDRNPTPEAEKEFKEISNAYEVLSNPARRAAYDSSRREILQGKKTKSRKESQGITIYHVNTVLAVIVVFILVFFWNIGKSIEVGSQARFAPSDAWQSSLLWMKANTPDPFGDPDAYYKLYEVPRSAEGFKYPESAYGVTSWWDNGYWITYIAKRLTSTNPSQEPGPITKVAKLFLSSNETLTNEIMGELKSSYIIADYSMSTGKFWAVVTWAGREQDEFTDIYYLPQQGKLVPVQLFYPEYYRSILVRLYNFDGKAVTSGSPVVIAYDEKVDRSGERYRQLTDIERFTSNQEAIDYIKSRGSANQRIVGVNPFISPIPLEAVQNYKLIYSSEQTTAVTDNSTVPEVKIFQYIK